MTTQIAETSPLILAEIKKANRILLHCHPSPDPDSVGSALAMKFALESLGKQVTLIRGDSPIPQAFRHFPGASKIIEKNFAEIDLADFDLFIILDSAAQEMISRLTPPAFPLQIKTIVIDHHTSNKKYADLNLVESTYPATAQILSDLFQSWGIKITRDIALNLFIGIYTDTGGFRFAGTTDHTLEIVAGLAKIAPDFNQIILEMERSQRPEAIVYQGLALSSLETFYSGRLAITKVPFELISEKKIISEDISGVPIANILLSVSVVEIGISLAEEKEGEFRVQFRSKNGERFDVSRLAMAFGGGGHKAAAGARVSGQGKDIVEKIVEKAKVLYNL